MGEKTTPITVTIYESQLREIEMLANKFYHGNRSRAVQMMIEFFISNRDPGTLKQELGDELNDLMKGFESEQVSLEEFKDQVWALAGGK